jgi:hypothetical protein
MESIKIIIEPYIRDTTDFTFIYESDAKENVEKVITVYEIGKEIYMNDKAITMEREIIRAIIKNK